MTELTTGVQVMNSGKAVELLSLAYTHDQLEYWWVKLLFVQPATELMTFKKGVAYKKLHTQTATQ